MVEPYKDAHRPWEPNSVDQVFKLVNLQAVDRDTLLYECVTNLLQSGFHGNDFAYGVLNMCQAADSILTYVMENSKHV